MLCFQVARRCRCISPAGTPGRHGRSYAKRSFACLEAQVGLSTIVSEGFKGSTRGSPIMPRDVSGHEWVISFCPGWFVYALSLTIGLIYHYNVDIFVHPKRTYLLCIFSNYKNVCLEYKHKAFGTS